VLNQGLNYQSGGQGYTSSTGGQGLIGGQGLTGGQGYTSGGELLCLPSLHREHIWVSPFLTILMLGRLFTESFSSFRIVSWISLVIRADQCIICLGGQAGSTHPIADRYMSSNTRGDSDRLDNSLDEYSEDQGRGGRMGGSGQAVSGEYEGGGTNNGLTGQSQYSRSACAARSDATQVRRKQPALVLALTAKTLTRAQADILKRVADRGSLVALWQVLGLQVTKGLAITMTVSKTSAELHQSLVLAAQEVAVNTRPATLAVSILLATLAISTRPATPARGNYGQSGDQYSSTAQGGYQGGNQSGNQSGYQGGNQGGNEGGKRTGHYGTTDDDSSRGGQSTA